MSTPSWLYYLFGVLMLAVAAYCLTLLILSVATNRRAGRDVEISHIFMGVSMAGMFVGQWAFGLPAVWEIIFGALLIWFLVESIQSVRQYGLHLPHALIHGVMNFSMLLMYWFPMSSTGATSMSTTSTGPKLDPGVALVVAFTLFASAIFTLASPNKGSSHFGSHAPAYVIVGVVGSEHPDVRPQGRPGSAGHVFEEIVATPWLVDLSHVVMCVAMGFMLLLLT
ncbi:MAG: DUF5134 domain-containing protein [Acidimicrobiales bacterium]|jgi:hypothetical protein